MVHCAADGIVCREKEGDGWRERETIDSSAGNHTTPSPPPRPAIETPSTKPLEQELSESVRRWINFCPLFGPLGSFDLCSYAPFSWSCKRFQRQGQEGGCFPTMHKELSGFTPLLPAPPFLLHPHPWLYKKPTSFL